ncbi:MAG: GNAT family N-acetyltransferase [Thermomicrobiales bacterium]
MAHDTKDAPSILTIRRARPDEAATLSALAVRSKAHWGYDEAFLDACREDLRLSPDDIAASAVYLAEGVKGPAGFYCLRPPVDGVAVLDDLFVEPAAIGQGVGRRLWLHAVATARELGCTELVIQSDPFAEGFYRAMDARRVGELESTVIPGRMLPLLRYAIRAAGDERRE